MIEMGANSITIVTAVTADFFFDCRVVEYLRMSELGTYHGASTIMRKALGLKISRISILEVEAVPQSCIL
jgi:hypothetical protein